MAYNLPPPWDAGFAIPDNVKDEGLERRGFVTKWMPRGTYDAPKVGSGGYALPAYVQQEPIGQGTFVTKWMPRGTQPNVPHYLDRRPEIIGQQSIGKRGVAVEFALSGTDADKLANAQRLLAQVAKLPKNQRRSALKAHLDSVDRSLWDRVCFDAQGKVAQGMDKTRAFTLALAKVMCATPQPAPSPGLGGYLHSMGATPTITKVMGNLEQAATATYSSGKSIGTKVSGQVIAQLAAAMCEVGPWRFPLAGGTITVQTSANPQWTDWIMKQLEVAGKHVVTVGSMAAFKNVTKINAKLGGRTVVTSSLAVTGKQPITKVMHPVNGEKWGIYLATSSAGMQLTFRKAEENWFTRAVNWIAELIAKIIEVAVDVLKNLPNIACALTSNPGAMAAAGTTPQGMAVAAGAYVVGQAACSPNPPPPPPDTGSSMLPLAIAGGVAAVAAVMLMTKKRTP